VTAAPVASVTVTGATGLVGSRLVASLLERGVDLTVLSRDPDRARARLGDVRVARWIPTEEPAPADALTGRDAVIHLAGAPLVERWNERVRRAIRDSRVVGTHNLLASLRSLDDARPHTLVSSSAIGYYGAHGDEPIDEEAPAGSDFLASVCVDWEAAAGRAAALGMRVVHVRTGVVLDPAGGALAKLLPPFRFGVGGPVAGGRQYVSWIHLDDLTSIYLAALGDERWTDAVNATAPQPVTNAVLARTLGAVLHRPAILPVPTVVLRLLYGESAELLTTGARVVPAKALVLGYEFAHPQLREALTAALAR
jgi:uncharacterized protein